MGILTTILILVIPLIFKGIDKYISNSANHKVSVPDKNVISDDCNDEGTETDIDGQGEQNESVITNIEDLLEKMFPNRGVVEKTFPKEQQSEPAVPVSEPVKVPVKKTVETPVKYDKASEFIIDAPAHMELEDEKERKVKKNKIDPKKLIIYSEIMKPKY